MIDVEMLERLARPSAVTIGSGPWQLEEVFNQVVAAGWEPRNPCTDERELAHLEASVTRGDCIAPLVMEGDVVYIDRKMPQPGDLVSFALSERGCEAQNSALPSGQHPWSKGARWIKMYAVYRGLEMLLDRHGGAATATLMACETPDDVPVLHPVRQIRRAGRLVFTPDHHSSQIGDQAATTITTAFVAGPNAQTQPGTKIFLCTVPAPILNCQLTATITFDVSNSSSTNGWTAQAFAIQNGVNMAGDTLPTYVNTGLQRFTVQFTWSVVAGFSIDVYLAPTVAASTTATFQAIKCVAETIKK